MQALVKAVEINPELATEAQTDDDLAALGAEREQLVQ